MLEALYGQFLRLYPRSFREEYGEAMLAVFREDGRSLRHFTDLFVSVPREWLTDHPAAEPGSLRLPPEFVAKVAENDTRDSQSIAFISFTITAFAVALAGWKQWGAFLVVFYTTVNSLCTEFAKYCKRRYWASFGVTIGDNVLVISSREGSHRVRRDTVKGLIESPGRGLKVIREGKRDIWIPAALTGYEQLRQELSTWRKLIRSGPGRILDI
jgi:hypothetical protein